MLDTNLLNLDETLFIAKRHTPRFLPVNNNTPCPALSTGKFRSWFSYQPAMRYLGNNI
jgi:hypothetical protein